MASARADVAACLEVAARVQAHLRSRGAAFTGVLSHADVCVSVCDLWKVLLQAQIEAPADNRSQLADHAGDRTDVSDVCVRPECDEGAVEHPVEAHMHAVSHERHVGDNHGPEQQIAQAAGADACARGAVEAEGGRGTGDGAETGESGAQARVDPVASWYALGAGYWSGAPASLSGVMGGLPEVHGGDVTHSRAFLAHAQGTLGVGSTRCLDVGAGIGRVTETLLREFFDTVDLLEQDRRMIAQARTRLCTMSAEDPGVEHARSAPILNGAGRAIEIHATVDALPRRRGSSSLADGDAAAAACAPAERGIAEHQHEAIASGDRRRSFGAADACNPRGKADRFYCCGIQEFEWPDAIRYDAIWIQWVVGCVLDADLVRFLRRAAAALEPNGCVVVKDNHCKGGRAFWYDLDDHSIARSRAYFECLCDLAGLDIVDAMEEPDWDDDLLPVVTYALRPRMTPAEAFRAALAARERAKLESDATVAAPADP